MTNLYIELVYEHIPSNAILSIIYHLKKHFFVRLIKNTSSLLTTQNLSKILHVHQKGHKLEQNYTFIKKYSSLEIPDYLGIVVFFQKFPLGCLSPIVFFAFFLEQNIVWGQPQGKSAFKPKDIAFFYRLLIFICLFVCVPLKNS